MTKSRDQLWRHPLPCAVLIVLAAACGTTVPAADQQLASAPSAAVADEAASPQTPIADPGDAVGPTTPRSPASVGGDRTVGAAVGTADAGSEQPASPSGSAVGAGITDSTITVGIAWYDVGAMFSAFAPTSDSETGSTKGLAEKVVAWMNARGGIAGREIKPIYHEWSVTAQTQSSSRSREEQAMCDEFTNDHRAFAAIPLLTHEGVFHNCAADRDLVSIAINNADETVDAQRFQEIGSVWYRPDWITGERRERVVVEQLDRRGFFTPETKVGVLVYDTVSSRRTYETALLPALAQIGVQPAAVAHYQILDNMNGTVLRFRSEGVTHVLWGACPCAAIDQSNFMIAAESQGYRPTYALSSDLYPAAMRTTAAPPDQLVNSVAIGWNPVTDIGDVGTGTSAERACVELAAEAGVSQPEHALVAIYCGALFFLKSGLESGAPLTTDGFREAVESFGTSFDPVTTFATRLGPGRHDGASAVRDLFFERDCDCWRYRGPVHAAG